MTTRRAQATSHAFCGAVLWLALMFAPLTGHAAPYAAIVMDARSGKILMAENADARLHPASLTKMLTLYIAFDAIKRGEISLDTMVTVSANAARQPPSRLGLRAGQRISMRNLIRAAAIKSANDAASAIGDAISGNEAAFAARMTRTAKALGMPNSTFKNANGLTAAGHLSTARDMNVLGRRLFYDFPEYYNLFSRITSDAGVARIANTNRRFLESYQGADGIKTGYTRAAGFNLTASAERGGKRIIATVFGGTSTANRNARMAALMDAGFKAAPANVAVQRPAAVALAPPADPEPPAVAQTSARTSSNGLMAGKTIRLITAVTRSPRPQRRPDEAGTQVAEAVAASVQAAIDAELRTVIAETVVAPEAAVSPVAPTESTPPRPRPVEESEAGSALFPVDVPAVAKAAMAPQDGDAPGGVAAQDPAPQDAVAEAGAPDVTVPFAAMPLAAADLADPVVAPADLSDPGGTDTAAFDAAADAGLSDADLPPEPLAEAGSEDEAIPAFVRLPAPLVVPVVAPASVAPPAPAPQFAGVVMTLARVDPVASETTAPPIDGVPAATERVARLSTSGARHWGVSLGRFNTRGAAERLLLQTALGEPRALAGALRKIAQRGGGYEATFAGLTQDQADLACRRLQARAIQCTTLGP